MDFTFLAENLTNPALLFFLLGIFAVQVKSDLQIPPTSSKFISLYLLFSIGFKGGQELAHSHLDLSILWSLLFGVFLAVSVPIYSFFILKKKVGIANAGAIAAAYGSVSAVTFVTAISFLDMHQVHYGGHMVAVMALMEAPSIIVGVLLMALLGKNASAVPLKEVVRHSVTNGSVLLILGSLLIGFIASDKQAEGIAPFTTDIFKGFLAVFLLDMGITSGKKLKSFMENGWFVLLFALIVPLVNGCLIAILSENITPEAGDRFLFAILAASASYIAVPAAMRLAAPEANEGLYLPMALAITFPFNITLGMPIYWHLITG